MLWRGERERERYVLLLCIVKCIVKGLFRVQI